MRCDYSNPNVEPWWEYAKLRDAFNELADALPGDES